MPYPIVTGDVPYITTEQMIEVDRTMIEDYHITLMQMMENAGRNLAHLARDRFFGGDPRAQNIIVLAGTGGNGGGAMVCARRLHNCGASVQVYLSTNNPDRFTPVPAHQLDILQRMGITITYADNLPQVTPDLIIDGLIGYSLKGAPRGHAKSLIEWANESPAPILALDAPSGIDTTTGTAFDPAMMATATMTLALPKVGFDDKTCQAHIGELYLADISVPPELYAKPPLDLQVDHIFAESDIVRLH